MATGRAKATARRRPRRWVVHLSCESSKLRLGPATLRGLVRGALAHVDHEIAPGHIREINVVLVDDARMREINREFRNKDKPTDVLSFPQFTKGEVAGTRRIVDESATYLGDLVISTETTIRQAKRFGVTTREELVRLVVHGILHLCGYDHEQVPPREAARMRRRERVIRGAMLARTVG